MKQSLFAAVLVVFAATASAEEFQVALSYTAADFESVESVKGLHRRIWTLAAKECPNYSRTRDLRASRSCRNGVVKNLVDAIDHPALTAYVEGGDELRIVSDTEGDRRRAG
jgi:UrcA family protein